jgi:hypothetical protein
MIYLLVVISLHMHQTRQHEQSQVSTALQDILIESVFGLDNFLLFSFAFDVYFPLLIQRREKKEESKRE